MGQSYTDDFEEIDFKSIREQRKQLERLTSDRYWNEFKGDWKGYLNDTFKYEEEPQPYVPQPKVEIKEEVNPFW